MQTTIDPAGRIVIPKAVREALGLEAGARVEIVERDGYIEIAPAAHHLRLEVKDGVVTAVADGDMPPLAADAVRETLERTRR